MGQLHDPCQEPGEVAEAVAAGQIAGLGVGDQIVIDQRELVPEGLEALPPRQLLGGIQLIQTAAVHCFDEFGEVGVEFVEDHIQPTALRRRGCWIPELHTCILFEYAFDSKQVPQ